MSNRNTISFLFIVNIINKKLGSVVKNNGPYCYHETY